MPKYLLYLRVSSARRLNDPSTVKKTMLTFIYGASGKILCVDLVIVMTGCEPSREIYAVFVVGWSKYTCTKSSSKRFFL